MRTCALHNCSMLIERSNQRYCSVKHANLAAKRRQRAREYVEQPYAYTVAQCPVDGTPFVVSRFPKGGRPRQYDCDECQRIAQQIRDVEREMRGKALGVRKP